LSNDSAGKSKCDVISERAGGVSLAGDAEGLSERIAAKIASEMIPARPHIDVSLAVPLLVRSRYF